MNLTILALCLSAIFSHASVNAGTEHRFHHPDTWAKSLSNDKHPGQKIYQQFCSLCHAKAPSIQLGAPRLGKPAEWQQRLKQPAGDIYQHVERGIGAMPAMGGCFECSKKQLQAAIDYLLNSLKVEKKQRDKKN